MKKPNTPLHPMEQQFPRKNLYEISWRIFRIMSEFVEGFQFLSQFKKEVTIFGSARLKPTNKWYKEAEKLGGLLVKSGYTVITGGGPGIMEGANKGAYKINPKKSIGINIKLPKEQRANPYIEHGKGFYYFFTRKVMLAASAQAYIFFPGGFGTLDEFFEMTTLVQTKKVAPLPIILVGKSFWQPLLKWIDQTMAEKLQTIDKKNQKLYTLVDTAEEAMKYIRKSKERDIF